MNVFERAPSATDTIEIHGLAWKVKAANPTALMANLKGMVGVVSPDLLSLDDEDREQMLADRQVDAEQAIEAAWAIVEECLLACQDPDTEEWAPMKIVPLAEEDRSKGHISRETLLMMVGADGLGMLAAKPVAMVSGGEHGLAALRAFR